VNEIGPATGLINARDQLPRVRGLVGGGGRGVINERARAPVGGTGHAVHRGLVWALVLMTHVALGSLIFKSPGASIGSAARIAPLMMVTVASKPSQRIAAAPPAINMSFGPIVAEKPSLEFVDETNADEGNEASRLVPVRGAITPPRRLDTDSDTSSFARAAGLRDGSSASVVLRVEVFGSGAVGRVEVDVSSGRPRIDEVAIAYARSLRWVGGREDEHPKTLWIRWGVTLQASRQILDVPEIRSFGLTPQVQERFRMARADLNSEGEG
jgi:hypothetical protein